MTPTTVNHTATTAGFGNYDRRPVVSGGAAGTCASGWPSVADRLVADSRDRRRVVIAVDCYPGVDVEMIVDRLSAVLDPSLVVRTERTVLSPARVDQIVDPYLGGNDPIFGRITDLGLDDLTDDTEVATIGAEIDRCERGVVLVVGTGAARFDHDIVVIADLPRWEIQRRQRAGTAGNLGAHNAGAHPSSLYKRSYFVDWRIADRWKLEHLDRADYLLDTTIPDDPRIVEGHAYRDALARTARRPFRLVPFFDPGPWGGHWMEAVCGLPTNVANHAWCFDCVPEENSLLLEFGDITVETPAINLVLTHPIELLGERVHERFGAEFPIRFDMLDTIGGGNLSLQVHPTTEYIAQFGMDYTQDESYYILEAGPDSCVYLGVQTGVEPRQMLDELRDAQSGGPGFDTDRYINLWPVRTHDHLLIPAGTIHCSGADTMVLEISATPYIFTFKLWDWGRLGLDGKPRPINIERGADVIDWGRNSEWVEEHLVDRVELLEAGDGWREERTGLHEAEFIETRRHWFSVPVLHGRTGSVDVLNLVHGAEATVESPNGSFQPFVIHYAETFVVPAAAGDYIVRPSGPSLGTECATIRATIRPTTSEEG